MEKFPLIRKEYAKYGYQKLVQNGGPVLDEQLANECLIEENGCYEHNGCEDIKSCSHLIKKVKGIRSNGCHSLAHTNGSRNGETTKLAEVTEKCCSGSVKAGFLLNGHASEVETCNSERNENECLGHEKQREYCCNGELHNGHENGETNDGEREHSHGPYHANGDHAHALVRERKHATVLSGCCRSDKHADKGTRKHVIGKEGHAHEQRQLNGGDHVHGHVHAHEYITCSVGINCCESETETHNEGHDHGEENSQTNGGDHLQGHAHANDKALKSCQSGREHGHEEGKHVHWQRHANEDHAYGQVYGHEHEHTNSSSTKGCCKSNDGTYEHTDNCCVSVLENSIKSKTNSNESIDDDVITATMITTRLRIQNICCGQEADLIKSALEPVDGVLSLSVNVIGRTAVVRHNPVLLPRGELLKVLNGLHLGVSIIDSGKSYGDADSFIKSLVLQAVLLMLIITLYSAVIYGFVNNLLWTEWVAIALISIGSVPILLKAFSNWRRQIFVDINLLMLMATIGISFLKQWLEGSTVVLIFYTAEILQSYCFYRVEKAVSGEFELQ